MRPGRAPASLASSRRHCLCSWHSTASRQASRLLSTSITWAARRPGPPEAPASHLTSRQDPWGWRMDAPGSQARWRAASSHSTASCEACCTAFHSGPQPPTCMGQTVVREPGAAILPQTQPSGPLGPSTSPQPSPQPPRLPAGAPRLPAAPPAGLAVRGLPAPSRQPPARGPWAETGAVRPLEGRCPGLCPAERDQVRGMQQTWASTNGDRGQGGLGAGHPHGGTVSGEPGRHPDSWTPAKSGLPRQVMGRPGDGQMDICRELLTHGQ